MPVMYWAVKNVQDMLHPLSRALTEVSVRWLVYYAVHSERDGDVLEGGKSENHGGNVADIAKGPLKKTIVEELDEMWLRVEDAMR